MGFVVNAVLIVILVVAFLFVMRRYQIRAARFARVEGLASRLLGEEPGGINRQDLADILRQWDDLKADQKRTLGAHLSAHPRLEGLDFSDPELRMNKYRELVGISQDKSPEK